MTDTTYDPNAILMGGGTKSFKYTTIGDTLKGTIVSFSASQQTDIKTGAPLFWQDGKPQTQIIIVVQTDLRDDADDDGLRADYIKQSTQKQVALRDALRAAGVTGLTKGSTIAIQLTGFEPSKTAGFNPKKLFAAAYRPALESAANDLLGAGNAQAENQEQIMVAPAPSAPTVNDLV